MSVDFETAPPFHALGDARRRELRAELLEAIALDSRRKRRVLPGHLLSGRRGYAVGLIGVAAAFFLTGALAFASADSGPAVVSSPGFAPSSGWTEVSTGTVPISDGPTAIAANVPIAAGDTPIGTFPTQTLASLPANGIVVYAVIGSRGQPNDANFPSSQLPLHISDAHVLSRWEGQYNSNVPEYQLVAGVGNYNLSVDVFFGRQQPSAEQLAAAQDELNQLEVPSS